MKYTKNGKQDLEGIITLTGNPIATYLVVGGNKRQDNPIKRTNKRK